MPRLNAIFSSENKFASSPIPMLSSLNLPPNLIHHVSRITYHVSRITHHASRIRNHASRITYYIICMVVASFTTLNAQTPCPNAPSGTPIVVNPTPATFSGGFPTTPIIIDGVFTVNSTFTMTNNPSVYLTPGSSIQLDGSSLTITQCILDGCNQHWDGIYADGPNETIIVNTQSIIQHSTVGISASNDAIIQVSNSVFRANVFSSIYLYNEDFGNGSLIESNVIETGVPIWPPYNTSMFQSDCGIFLDDCAFVDIGNPSVLLSGNKLNSMRNGILAYWGNLNNDVHIGIYNNRFEVLNDPTMTNYDVLTQAYTAASGAGIYAEYPSFAGYVVDFEVANTNTSLNTLKFQELQKGIITTGVNLKAKNLFMEDNLLSIMNTSVDNDYVIENNDIRDTHLGIVVHDIHKTVSINNNLIQIEKPVLDPQNFNLSPIGIVLDAPATSMLSNNSVIESNEINILSIAGTGILNENGGAYQLISQNYITFNTTDPSVVPNWLPKALVGIESNFCSTTLIMNNRVDGIDGSLYPSSYQNHMSYGIYLAENEGDYLRCNKIKHTAFGLYAYGSNDANLVNANKTRNNLFPWYFENNTTNTGSCSFGNIGSPTVDMENDFVYLNQSSMGIPVLGLTNSTTPFSKVFRNNPTTFGNIIFTNSSYITQPQSNASTILLEYQILNPVLPTLNFCEFDSTFADTTALQGNYGLTESRYENHRNVANGSTTYTSYPDIGLWMDRIELFQLLKSNANLRNSHTDFITFFSNFQNTNTEQIVIIKEAVKLLATYTRGSSQYQQQAGLVQTLLNSFTSSFSYENDWKQAINIQVKTLTSGYSSLSSAEVGYLEARANSCFYEFGLAVKICRSLEAYYHPSHIQDDRYFCSGIAAKGDSDFNIESYLLNKSNLNIEIGDSKIEIYPNPTNGNFTIRTSSKNVLEFQLYTLQGKEIKSLSIEPRNNMKNIDLQNYNLHGLYFYRVVDTQNATISSGKLIFE